MAYSIIFSWNRGFVVFSLYFIIYYYLLFFFIFLQLWYWYDLTVGSGGSNNTTWNTAVITLYAAEITTLALVIIFICTEPSALLPHLHIKDSSNNNPCATLYHMDSAKSVISSYYFRQTLNSIGWISLPTLCRSQPRTSGVRNQQDGFAGLAPIISAVCLLLYE